MLNSLSALGRKLSALLVLGAALVQPTSTFAQSAPVWVRVVSGDSLDRIARRSGLSVAQLRQLNGLSGDKIKIGQVLKVRASSGAKAKTQASSTPAKTVRVLSGDSLDRIARRSGLSVAQLKKLNGLSSDKIVLGQTLRVSGGTPIGSSTRVVKSAPQTVRTYTVQPGNSLERIAKYFKVGVAQLKRWNGLSSDRIQAGQVLRLSPNPALEAQQRAQYRKYLALKAQQHRILQARYAKQAKYERYLALQAEQRRILQARYAKQVKYEQYLASLERARQAKQQALAATKRYNSSSYARGGSPSGVTRRTSFIDTSNNTLSWPLSGFQLTSRFGTRDIWVGGSNVHTGLDLAAPVGTPVRAASSGTVTVSGYGDYGLNVWTSSGGMQLIYGHMSRTAVQEGQFVNRGDVLGFVGCTGFCTGPHLHFEVRMNGSARDPMGFMR